MSPNRPNLRLAPSRALRVATLVAMSAALLGASGCHWFRKHDYYSADATNRPLEFPPAFDAAEAERASRPAGPVTRSSLPGGDSPAVQASSFAIAGDRASAFAKVGEALAATPDLTVVNRAQLLGAFDVDYGGEKFLLRITDLDGGRSLVAAVDPRGLPAGGQAAARLIASLKKTLGGQ